MYICGVRKQRIEKGLTPSASPSEVQMNFESVGLAAGMLNTENVRFPSQKIPPPSSSFSPFFFCITNCGNVKKYLDSMWWKSCLFLKTGGVPGAGHQLRTWGCFCIIEKCFR